MYIVDDFLGQPVFFENMNQDFNLIPSIKMG